MGYVDMTSHDYQAFNEKGDQYAVASPNGVPNGKYRMTNVESIQTKLLGDSGSHQAKIANLERQVNTLTGLLADLVKVVKSAGENMEAIMDHLDIQPAQPLVDAEFFAAAANPEKYEREQGKNAD